MQVRDIFQTSPDELPAIDIHSLWPQPSELPQGVDRLLEKAVSVLTEEIADTPPDAADVRYATQRDASGR